MHEENHCFLGIQERLEATAGQGPSTGWVIRSFAVFSNGFTRVLPVFLGEPILLLLSFFHSANMNWDTNKCQASGRPMEKTWR